MSARKSVKRDKDDSDVHGDNIMTELPSGFEERKDSPEKEPLGVNEFEFRGWRLNKVLLSTHVNIFLYSACFWIQTGTLPYLSKKLGVDPLLFGYLQTTFAVVQLAGGPLYGRFGDLFGGKMAMTLAFSAASLTYLLLGFSTSVPILFLSRLPSMFMHAMQGGQMIVTDMGDSSKRVDALGKLGLSYGIGMVIGPVIGGLCTKYLGEQEAAFVAFCGSILSIVIVYQFVPARTKKVQVKDTSAGSMFSLQKWKSLVFAPGAFFLLCIRMAGGVPIGVFQSMFQVVALNTFHLPADLNGYLMSYIGILTMIVQGVGLGIVTKRFSENNIMKWSAFLLVWSYLLLAFVTNVTELCIVMAPMVVGLASQNIVISSALTRTVDDVDTGAMLGLNMAVNSLIRTVSPTIGGIMLEKLGFPSFGYFGFLTTSIITAVLFFKFKN